MASETILERRQEADENEVEVSSDTRQFVAFLVGGEIFAVDMTPVQEIIRLPQVVRVPLAPDMLEGLANLRGRVLPIISLRRIFGFEDQAHDDTTRALVINIGQPLGFVVDRVASVINVEPGQIEEVDGAHGTIDTDLLTGILKDVGGYPVVMVLDFARLIAKQFGEIAALASTSTMASAGIGYVDNDEEAHSEELQLVSFAVAGQEYAIDIANVQEIVQVPQTIVRVPNSPAHVLGLMTLRERLLPLVSLRSFFGLSAKETDERSRVVVVTLGATAVGLVTDSVSEVLRVAKSEVDAMPPLLTRDGTMSDITQICRLEDGKRLVSIISAENMFRHTVVKDALRTVAENANDDTSSHGDDESGREDEEQVVVFRLADGEFGVPIESVQEIVRVPEELTHVPKAPSFVEGVINLRGTVLPVIDQRKRLDLQPVARNDRQRIMVFLISGTRTGFIVDSVTEVLKIPETQIGPAPRLSGDQSRLLGRVANLEKQRRLIQLIDPAYLIDDADRERLVTLAQ